MHYLIYQKHPLSNERVLHKEGGLIITITDNLYDFAKELFQKQYDRYLFYDDGDTSLNELAILAYKTQKHIEFLEGSYLRHQEYDQKTMNLYAHHRVV